jgi:hypothetical protein
LAVFLETLIVSLPLRFNAEVLQILILNNKAERALENVVNGELRCDLLQLIIMAFVWKLRKNTKNLTGDNREFYAVTNFQ